MSNMPITLMEDSPPYLDFSVQAKRVVDKGGVSSYEDCEIVTITPMGDNKTQVIKEVAEWMAHLKERRHNQMISDNYLRFCEKSYEAWKDKREAPINGMPLEQCAVLSPAEIKMIRDANIRSVEDLAKANEEALSIIGMGARNLKRKAEAYLSDIKDHGAVAEKQAALEADLKASNDERDRLAERLAMLEQRIDAEPPVGHTLGVSQPEAIEQ